MCRTHPGSMMTPIQRSTKGASSMTLGRRASGESTSSVVTCPSCGIGNSASAVRCQTCHGWLFASGRCTSCGGVVDTAQGHCVYCGVSFDVFKPERYTPPAGLPSHPSLWRLVGPSLAIGLVMLLATLLGHMNPHAALGIWFLGTVLAASSWVFVWSEWKRAEEGIFRPSNLPPL
jgi:hypothetical protein